jgi:hypothetical protein
MNKKLITIMIKKVQEKVGAQVLGLVARLRSNHLFLSVLEWVVQSRPIR